MEYLALAKAYGTPGLLFSLIILVVYLLITVKILQKSVEDIKDGITWGDTCGKIHDEVNRRFDRLEKTVDKIRNG